MKEKIGRSFVWLNVTQFCGALNDNLYKFFMVFLLIAIKGENAAGNIMAISSAVFVLPFLMFLSNAGVLADKTNKNRIAVWVKLMELGAMLLGCVAFVLKSEIGLYAVLFLMAAQSALFSPSKYGIIPELVGKEKLAKANGYIQAFTFIAIILGTILAPLLAPDDPDKYIFAAMFCVFVSVAGLLSSLMIGQTPAASPGKKFSLDFVSEIWRTLLRTRKDSYLFGAILASGYFLLLGAFMQINGIPYGIIELGLTDKASTLLFLFGAFGIAAGSLLAGKLSGRNIELGIVPLAALGLFVSSIGMATVRSSVPPVAAWIFIMGVSSGMFIVPIEAWIQYRSPRRKRGKILAASGFLSWIGVLLASALMYIFTNIFKMGPREGFFVMGIMTLILSIATFYILPDFFLRFAALVVTHICYKLKIKGVENVPSEGGALLVCNHVSWVDAFLLSATQQRRIRFMMLRPIYENRFLNPFFRLMGVIPVSPDDSPRRLVESLRHARTVMDQGFIVCIFAEGALTRNGNMLEFRPGFERIMKDSPHPVIPAYLGGAWGSIFSYAAGKPLSRLPSSFPYPVSIIFGKPMPPESTAGQVRETVSELATEYFEDMKRSRRPVAECFVKTARANWGRPAIADAKGKNLTYGETLASSLILADRLNKNTAGQGKIGVFLPASVSATLVNTALSLLDKVPVNLDFTASPNTISSILDKAGVQTVVTSRAFLERFDSTGFPDNVIYLENLFLDITDTDRRNAWLKARFLPARLLCMSAGFDPDRMAAVMFETGMENGVMLSHHNIISTVESCRALFQPSRNDCICAPLPFSHSFGFLTTLWLPLLSGIKTVYVSSHNDAAKTAEEIRSNKATIIFTTQALLVNLIKHASTEDLKTLRMIFTGDKKLRARLAAIFERKFNITPLACYGRAELSGIATLNIPDVDRGGVRQPGTKQGTAGHPLPGVAVLITAPETGNPLPPDKPGILRVKGPNVMLGYLDNPESTQKVIKDGWLNTGDTASLDKDGFVSIA